MAAQEHLDRLKEGISAWNAWRAQHPLTAIDLSYADLSYADLSGIILWDTSLYYANLSYADLSNANLRGANLSRAILNRIDLSNADLSGANLSGISLYHADLSRADLSGANLSNADLSSADFSGANLNGANLYYARLSEANFRGANLSSADLSATEIGGTIFADVDLRSVKGLETISHTGPSTIGTDTLLRSQGDIPEAFLRGAGLDDALISYVHSLVSHLNQYYTCFISYSSRNQDFTERLYGDLQAQGIRCWYAPEDLKIGDYFPEQIEQAVRSYDKLIVILSEHSVNSPWVEDEVRAALEKEERLLQQQRLRKTVLFPIIILSLMKLLNKRRDNGLPACADSDTSATLQDGNSTITTRKLCNGCCVTCNKSQLLSLSSDTDSLQRNGI